MGCGESSIEVFGRLAGDNTMPAIHRMESAFGGGKTHTLIAGTRLAFRGDELADVVRQTLDSPEYDISGRLPGKGEIAVVGIAGEDIPVSKPRGSELIPYTLWGEIAFQIGGEKLYASVNGLRKFGSPRATMPWVAIGGCFRRGLIAALPFQRHFTRPAGPNYCTHFSVSPSQDFSEEDSWCIRDP